MNRQGKGNTFFELRYWYKEKGYNEYGLRSFEMIWWYMVFSMEPDRTKEYIISILHSVLWPCMENTLPAAVESIL